MKAWEFTFMCVAHGETKEEALEAALAYIAEVAEKKNLEPTDSKELS